MSFLGVSLGVGAVTAGAKIFSGIHQNKLANQINPQWTQYQTSPFAQKQLATAQQLYGGRMPGAAEEERNIGASQAQFLNNINSNATDSGQALAVGGLSQGTANQAYGNLQTKELQSKNDFLNNLNAAYQGMVGEGNKVYQSKLDKYQQDVQAKMALRNAGMTNVNSGLNDLGSEAFLGSQYGLFGNKKTPTTQTNPNTFNPFNMNEATGGLGSNWNTLQSGNPFANNYSSYQNPYGE